MKKNGNQAVKRIRVVNRLKSINSGTLASFSLISGIIGQGFMYFMKNIPAGLFFFFLAVAAIVLADKRISGVGKSKTDFFPEVVISKKTEMAVLAFIAIAAAFFRLYKIDSIPAGCFFDEALNGLAAVDILNGKSMPVFIGAHTSKSVNNASMFMYPMAAIFKFFGAGSTQVRLVPAIMGILAVPAFYFLARRLAGTVPALAGAFILAVMRWHFSFSRIGFHAAFGVLAVILVFYFVFRVYREKTMFDFIMLGFTLSLSLYTYQSARLLPFVVMLFAVFVFSTDRNYFRENFQKIVISAGIAFIVFLPLGYYIVENQNTFIYRQKQVSIFSAAVKWSPEAGELVRDARGKAGVLLGNVKDTLLMFNSSGDVNNRHNLPGQPALAFFTGVFAVIGLGIALTGFLQPANFFFTSGFFILMCAGFLTIEAPQSLRTILAVPCVIFFMLVFTGRFTASFRTKETFMASAAVIGVLLLISGAENFDIYFNRQASNPRCWADFSTNEYSAGLIAKSALSDGWRVEAIPYYMNHPSFNFALGGLSGCGTFDITSFVPAELPAGKGVLYMFTMDFSPLNNFIKEIYPNTGTYSFKNKYDGSDMFTYCMVPAGDLNNVSGDFSKKGAELRFFHGRNFTGVSVKRKVPVIMIAQYKSPEFAVHSAVWSAKIEAPVSGNYSFYLRSMGASCLYMDKKILERNPDTVNAEGVSENTAEIYLKKGSHSIKVEYNNLSADSLGLWVLWTKPGESELSIISGSLLSPE